MARPCLDACANYTRALCRESPALGAILLAGIIASYRIGSIRGALKVDVFAGLISAAIVFATLLGMTFLFHSAMMVDPSNMHEFALNAHRTPTRAELSKFLSTLMRLSDPAPL